VTTRAGHHSLREWATWLVQRWKTASQRACCWVWGLGALQVRPMPDRRLKVYQHETRRKN